MLTSKFKQQCGFWLHGFLLLCCLFMSTFSLAKGQTDDGLPSAQGSPKHLTVTVGQDSFPYQFGADGAKADGLLVDIWKVWAKKNGYVLDFKVGSWQKTMRMLESGEADFHAGMAITPQRQQAYLLGKPVVPIHAAIFVHKQLSGISDVQDLLPYVVGVVAESSHIATLSEQVPGIRFKQFESRKTLFEAAGRNEIRAFAGLSRGMPTHPDFASIANQFPLYKKLTYQVYDMTYAVRQDNQALAAIIEQGLNQISADEIAVLERKWLGLGTQTNALVISTQVDMAPFMSVSAEGEPIGLFVDIWRKWSEKTSQKVVFMTDNRVLSMQNLQSKKADIHAAYADNAINADTFPHAHHIYSYNSKIYYPLAEGKKELTKDALAKSTLGVTNTDPVTNTLMKRYPQVELVRFNDLESLVEATLKGTVDGFVAGAEVAHMYLLKNNLHAKFAAMDNTQLETKLYSLVRQDNKALVSQIKAGFEMISIDELRAMEKRWIETPGSQYFNNLKAKINYTAAEKNWLLRHPVLRLGALANWAPIEFVDENGDLIGVTNDLMKIVEKRAQVSVEVQLFDEWANVLEALKKGEIDFVASMEKTPDRQSFAVFTEGYWPQHWGLITPGSKGDIHSLSQLSGKRLAVVKGYQLIPHIHERFPKILLQIVPDARSGFAAVRNGQADAFIDGMVALASELREGEYRDMSFSLVDDLEPALERFGIRKDYQPLAGILNKVIHTITDDEKKQILENWFELKIESGIETEKVLQFGALVLVVFMFILIWNRRLSSEINLRRAIEEKMKHMATHDELTQLPNRVLLRDRLSSAISAHARRNELLALMFIDLDGFKDVNDTYGHDVGDELLVQLGERFRKSVRRSDTTARFGGDEFVVLLTQLHNREQTAEVCEKLLEVIKQPFALSRCTVEVGASIGIAMYPEDGTSDTDLMKVADTLMYKVKTSGKDGYLFVGDDEPAGSSTDQ